MLHVERFCIRHVYTVRCIIPIELQRFIIVTVAVPLYARDYGSSCDAAACADVLVCV